MLGALHMVNLFLRCSYPVAHICKSECYGFLVLGVSVSSKRGQREHTHSHQHSLRQRLPECNAVASGVGVEGIGGGAVRI